MMPLPQEQFNLKEKDYDGENSSEKVVISGMAGLFPEAHNVKELSDILYNKKNPITSKNIRWQFNHPEVAQFTGSIPELDRFDAQFFKVHYHLCHNMDAMARKVLEQSYQAIYDAGISPELLSGKKIGVFTGSCFSESEKMCFYAQSSRGGFGMAGCSKTMFANRISYWLNAKGPSMGVDQACCSSTEALELGYLAITRGDCEAAIVAGCNLCLHPQSSIHYGRIMNLSVDGKTKSFDNDASGCTKSEAVNVLFMQKAKDALRVYAEVVNVECQFTSLLEDKSGPRYGFYRDAAVTANFIKDVYEKKKVRPEAVEYVEAFGSAVLEVDKMELDVFSEVFCKNRKNPLLVGSVMSNIGYGEAASGISAIIKVLLGYHTGQLAANLNCNSPRTDVAALKDQRIRIVTEHQAFDRTYAAVNGISVTGVNSHVVLHGRYKPKDLSRYKSNIPYLVLISARKDSAVNNVFNDLTLRSIDPEELALLQNIHKTKISGHMGRGFTILDTNEHNETVSLHKKIDYFDKIEPSLCFVYSGMGSQWIGMGTHLMRIPIFAAAIQRCHRVLQPKGIDIIHIITSSDKTMFDNILYAFLGIAAIQIGLTDILQELGFVPDKIIGHSVGELGCGYADGCLTTEEMILAAYSRGAISLDTPFIRGSMAAVGIGYKQISKLCPPEIDVACHNGPESSTISGPADVMREFVEELKKRNIFAREVPCSNIAYHSRYIADAGPALLKYMKEIIKTPKLRSNRWISTSVPMENCDSPEAKHCSAEYFTNNLLKPVLFEEMLHLIPSNAVLIEIAPHGLLQAILKRSLPETCQNVPLTRRNHPDNAVHLLEAIGKLYMEGFHPKIEALYPKIEFPVSTGTPFLSHLVEWEHSEKWNICTYSSAVRKSAAACTFVISIHDDEQRYLRGHIKGGKNVYPFSAALVLVWDTLAMSLNMPRKLLSVHFHDVYLHAEPILHDRRQLRLHVALHRGTGRFEVLDNSSKVISGFIDEKFSEKRTYGTTELGSAMYLDSEDIYGLLYENEYGYKDDFRSIVSINVSATEALLRWHENWVTLIDGMFQMNILQRHNNNSISNPQFIKNMYIDVEEHLNAETCEVNNETVIKAALSLETGLTKCGGILMDDIKFRCLTPSTNKTHALTVLKFVPHYQSTEIKEATALQLFTQVVAENLNKDEINIIEIVNYKTSESAFKELKKHVDNYPAVKSYSMVPTNEISEEQNITLAKVDLFLVTNLSMDKELTQMFQHVVGSNTFILNKEEHVKNLSFDEPSALYRIVFARRVAKAQMMLVRWRPSNTLPDSVLSIRSQSELSHLYSKQATLQPYQKLLVHSSYPPVNKLRSLIKQWRKEFDRQIYLVMTNHVFPMDHLKQRANLDLAFTIFDHETWGGEYYVPLEDNSDMGRNITLHSDRYRDFSFLHRIESLQVGESGVPITVHYAGITKMDVQKASGIIPSNECDTKMKKSCYGFDFSGVTDSGCRLMGISREALKAQLRVQLDLLWPVPAHWSLEDAASIPLPYCMAFYCLGIKSQLLPKHRVLVHSGAGALGQAMISVALGLGCKVFTTVSDMSKKVFLLKLFPSLKAEHIGNSRDHTFGDMVLNETNGDGCDIVICCLKNELKNISQKCCREFGIVFDISYTQNKNREHYNFGMNNLTNERTFMAIDISSLLSDRSTVNFKKLQMLMSEGIARGYVRPLSRVTYDPQDISRAYRLLAASNHRGRVLIKTENNCHKKGQHRFQTVTCGCHVIIADTELFGIKLAESLVNRGATKLHLNAPTFSKLLEFKIFHFPATVNIMFTVAGMRLKRLVVYLIVSIVYARNLSWKKFGIEVKVTSEVANDVNKISSFLNDSRQLGDLEGICLAFTDDNNNTNPVQCNTTVELMDAVSRKMCPTLKYFVVLSTIHGIAEDTCTLRQKDQLPATLIKLPQLKKTDNMDIDCKKTITMHDAINTIEKALNLSESIVSIETQNVTEQTVLQQIAEIADISISDDAPNSMTLKQLGIDTSKIPEIFVFLRDVYHTYISEEQILSLTKQNIEEIQRMENTKYQEGKGLEKIISFVDSDELLVTTQMVFMPTLANNSTLRDDEFDVNQTSLCIVPGIEGHHARFSLLCERLKLPALVLQPSLDQPTESLQEQAQRFAKILTKQGILKQEFYLLGYETGITVVLEMASILENQGFTRGTVFCLGGTPNDFKCEMESQLRSYDTEEELQVAVLRHIICLMTGEETVSLKDIFKTTASWREKVEVCVRTFLGYMTHSAQYARDLIEAAYERIVQARCYSLTLPPLRSRIVFLRSKSCESDPHYLQQFSQQPLIVHELHAPMSMAAQDLRCSAFINRYLSQEILETFNSCNLCESYLLNGTNFFTLSEIS